MGPRGVGVHLLVRVLSGVNLNIDICVLLSDVSLNPSPK